MLRERLLHIEWLRNLTLAETWTERLAIVGRGLLLLVLGIVIFLAISFISGAVPGSYR